MDGEDAEEEGHHDESNHLSTSSSSFHDVAGDANGSAT